MCTVETRNQTGNCTNRAAPPKPFSMDYRCSWPAVYVAWFVIDQSERRMCLHQSQNDQSFPPFTALCWLEVATADTASKNMSRQ